MRYGTVRNGRAAAAVWRGIGKMQHFFILMHFLGLVGHGGCSLQPYSGPGALLGSCWLSGPTAAAGRQNLRGLACNLPLHNCGCGWLEVRHNVPACWRMNRMNM